MTAPLYLIACSAAKAPFPCPARELYRGDLFRKSVDYAEWKGSPWVVLSALHGVLLPDQIVAPYDTTMSDLGKQERAAWASRVNDALAALGHSDLVALAGQSYRQPLLEHPRFRHCFPKGLQAPMQGLGIGLQKAWLAREMTAPPQTLCG